MEKGNANGVQGRERERERRRSKSNRNKSKSKIKSNSNSKRERDKDRDARRERERERWEIARDLFRRTAFGAMFLLPMQRTSSVAPRDQSIMAYVVHTTSICNARAPHDLSMFVMFAGMIDLLRCCC